MSILSYLLTSIALVARFSLAILLLNSTAFAASEVIPTFTSEEEITAFLALTQRQIPFASHNNRTKLNLQIQGIANLRQKFPDYDKWMAAKPSPIVIEVFQQEIALEMSYFLKEERLQILRHQTDKHFAAELQALVGVKSENLFDELQKRAMQNLKSIFQNSGNSIRGLMIGMAQILPPQDRGEFLKLGDPKQQLEALRHMNISDETLRKSAFKAATVGLQQESVTMEQVLAVAAERMNQTEGVFAQLAYLKFLSKASGADIRDEIPSKVLNAADFEFAVLSTDAFLGRILAQFKTAFSNESILTEKIIEAFQAGVPRSLFQQAQDKKQILKPLGTVYEVHPYLGIHRGCLGGDCSTTNSPMFPYSPWEHDFFIKNADGRFVGYISGARLMANGIESFLLRDIQGAQLAPALAEAILHAFPKALEHFGVKQFVIARPEFTNAQNNSSALKQMLTPYNTVASKIVPLIFTDAAIRDHIGTTGTFSSTYTYDSPTVHPTGVLFVPESQIEKNIAVRIRPGTLPVPEPRTLAQAYISAIRLLLKDPQTNLLEFAELNSQNVQQDLAVFLNQNKLNLATYYRSLDGLFKKYKIEFNKEFREAHEDLFILGHLRASDAFYQDLNFLQDKLMGGKSDDKKQPVESFLTKLSEKYLLQMSRQHQKYLDLMAIVSSFKDVLPQNKRFRELLQLYSERMMPQDVYQLIGFAHAGITEAKELLTKNTQPGKIEEAVLLLFKNGPEALGLPPAKSQHPVSKLYAYISNPWSFSLLQFHQQLTLSLTNYYGLDMANLQNKVLQNLIEDASTKTHLYFQNANIESLTALISSQMQLRYEERKPHKVVMAFEWLTYRNREAASALVPAYISELTKRHNPGDLIELALLNQMGHVEARQSLELPEMRVPVLELVKMLATTPAPTEIAKFSAEFANIPRAMNLIWQFPAQKAQSSGISKAFANLEAFANVYGTTAKEIIKIGRVKEGLATWLSYDDIFSHPSTNVIELALELTLNKIKTTAAALPEPFFLKFSNSNFNYLSQKPAFQKFLQELHRDAISGNCLNCTLGLFWMIAAKKIPDTISQHKQVLEQLIATGLHSPTVFATARAYERKIPLRLTDAMVLSVLYGLTSTSEQNTYPLLKYDSLEILRKAKGNRPNLHKPLGDLVFHSPSNKMALRAALALMANGGDRDTTMKFLTANYDRAELFGSEISPSDAKLFERFKARVSRDLKTCSALFFSKNFAR